MSRQDWKTEIDESTGVLLSSFDTMDFRTDDEDDLLVYAEGDLAAWIPLAVLANHLRLMGWTVTPPSEEANGG